MEAAPRLSFVQRQEADVLILELLGNLTLGETDFMRQEIYKVLDAGHRKVLLNLARLRHLDSTAVGLLVGAKTSAINRNVQLKVCCVPPHTARLLAQLQLNKILDVYEQESAALQDFT